MTSSEIEQRVRSLLASVLERDPGEVARLPVGTPLFGSGLDLDSLTGLQLLHAIQGEFGVDIASEDLNFDSLHTIGTLTDYLSGRAMSKSHK